MILPALELVVVDLHASVLLEHFVLLVEPVIRRQQFSHLPVERLSEVFGDVLISFSACDNMTAIMRFFSSVSLINYMVFRNTILVRAFLLPHSTSTLTQPGLTWTPPGKVLLAVSGRS